MLKCSTRDALHDPVLVAGLIRPSEIDTREKDSERCVWRIHRRLSKKEKFAAFLEDHNTYWEKERSSHFDTRAFHLFDQTSLLCTNRAMGTQQRPWH